jgi:hypothetical protein
LTYSLVWPIKDVKTNELLYRDHLIGVDETKWRSARLYPWFNVFEEYYQQEYKKFLDAKPSINALELHE